MNSVLLLLTFVDMLSCLSSTVSADCTCNGYINERGQGECKNRYRGKEFCYVKAGTCSDQKKSSSVNRWWSYQACQTTACVHKGQTYQQGDTFNDGCNNCMCSRDGSVSCTEKVCLPTATCVHKGQTYPQGAEFKEGCNNCLCNRDERVSCTEKLCLPTATCVHKGQTYQPGATFNDGCNNCMCSRDGSVSCTEKLCVPTATCVHKGQTYQPGATFNDGCNNCKCSRDGRVSCTEMLCLPTAPCEHEDNIYQIGDTFPENSGFCPAQCECKEKVLATFPPRVRGVVTCLPTPCPPPTCEHNGQYYHQGDNFKDKCNQCTCKKDGSVLCTKIFCFGK